MTCSPSRASRTNSVDRVPITLAFAGALTSLAYADDPAPTDPTSEPEQTHAAPAPAPAAPPPPDEPAAEEHEEGGLGPINGETFAYVRAPFERGDFQQVSASLWLRARPRLTDATSAGIELALDRIEAAPVGGPRFRAALREAYVSMRKHGWLLRVGQQIIPWGSSDVVNPTDVLTAHDHSVFVVEAEKTRTGGMSVSLSKAWSHVEATIVATPRHPATVQLIPPSILPPGVTIAEAAPYEPTLENTEVAAKLKFSEHNWDFSWMAFRGFNHTPEFEVVSADDMGAVVRPTHHRIYVAGVDGSVSVGKLVARIEGAFVRTENAGGTDPTIQPTHVFGVFGLERPLGDRVRVQAQAIVRSYPRWTALDRAAGPDPATTNAMHLVAAANALLLDYQGRQRSSGTVRIAYLSEEERFAIEVFGAMNIADRDYLVRPIIGWRPTEAVNLQLGAEVYRGPETRPLGALRQFSGAFLQTSFTF